MNKLYKRAREDSFWNYGIVRDKRLILCEIYWGESKTSRPSFYCPLSLLDILRHPFMIIKDIRGQLKHIGLIDFKDFEK